MKKFIDFIFNLTNVAFTKENLRGQGLNKFTIKIFNLRYRI